MMFLMFSVVLLAGDRDQSPQQSWFQRTAEETGEFYSCRYHSTNGSDMWAAVQSGAGWRR